MNTFFGIHSGSFLDELNYLKKLGFDKKRENEIWNKFCLNCDTDNDNKDDRAPRQFSSHPKRLCSDTDASVVSSRRTSLSSRDSNPNVDITQIKYIFQENKIKIQNARKKLHKNLTQTRSDGSYRQLDFGMGDSCTNTITPPNCDEQDKIITYYDSAEKFAEEQKGKCTKKNLSTIPSKKIVPSFQNSSKSSPLLNSSRNIVTDSVFEKKFKMFVEKSLHSMMDIRSLLEGGIIPPDGEEDESRRNIRVKEFSNRFSRNYLYPLARQIEELMEIEPFSPNINQKLLSSYQVILNGLQAYHSHFPTSTGTCSSDRLKSLLAHLLQLCDIHTRLIRYPKDNVDSEFINTFRSNAELTLQKIEERFSTMPSTESMARSNLTRANIRRPNQKVANAKFRKNNLESRLSMYNISAGNYRKDPHWSKMMELWAKKRANVKSRYKTATYRHRPPIEKKVPDATLPSKCKLFPKKSSTILKRTPMTTPVDEDNITTMVQMENDKDGRAENRGEITTGLTADHEAIVVRLLQLVLETREGCERGGGETDGDGDEVAKVADIMQRMKADGNVEVLRKVLEAVRQGLHEKGQERQDQLQLQVVGSAGSLEEESQKRRKEPIITVTGEKNAKLICITDENSIIETDESKLEDKDCSTEKNVPMKVVSSTETQTDVASNKKNKSTQKAKKAHTFKMKRLPKSSKYLDKLPKDYAVSIIQYKLDFHKHCKQNPMYKRTTNIQPWILMGQISDKILDGALLGVAREIELNDVVQQIYDSELQL